MTHLNFTQMLRICPTGHLIAIKQNCLVPSQLRLGIADIMPNFKIALVGKEELI